MKCIAFKPIEKNTLRGFCTLVMDSGMVLVDCAFHTKGESSWVAPPSKPMLDVDKRQVIGQDGKPAYLPVIDFVDTATRRRWSDAVVTAIETYLADERQ